MKLFTAGLIGSFSRQIMCINQLLSNAIAGAAKPLIPGFSKIRPSRSATDAKLFPSSPDNFGDYRQEDAASGMEATTFRSREDEVYCLPRMGIKR